MRKFNMTRRRFLGLVGVGGAIAVVSATSYPYIRATGYPYVRRVGKRLLKPIHTRGPSDDSPFDHEILTTVAVFTAALFGQNLKPDNMNELRDRLDFAVKQDSGWREEYVWLANCVNAAVRNIGSADVASATFSQRDALAKRLMTFSPWSARSVVLGLVSGTERERRRMYFSTIPHLTWIYGHSGIPFRLRGYTSWPGIPGDPREYTRKGPDQEC